MVFITSNLLTAENQICGKVLVANEKINSLILLLVRLFFRRYKKGKFLQLFLQLPKYVLRIYVVRCFKLVPGILYGDLLLFFLILFLQFLSSILQNVEV